jgi:hypothetical protein
LRITATEGVAPSATTKRPFASTMGSPFASLAAAHVSMMMMEPYGNLNTVVGVTDAAIVFAHITRMERAWKLSKV